MADSWYMKVFVETVADSMLHGAVCRKTPELWPIFGSSNVTLFEVSLSSSLWQKVEEQTIAVFHSRLCHCSTISVQIV